MQEQKLVVLAQSGNKEALGILLRDNYPIIYGYLLKVTLNEEEAKDITQEVMVKAIININRFLGEAKFSTWLISIASNTFKDNLRRKKRYSAVDINEISLEAPDNVEEQVINKEMIDRLKKSLLKIPEEKRMAFVLKHFYHYSYEEIGQILKCPIGTVRSRLHYCIKKLQNLV